MLLAGSKRNSQQIRMHRHWSSNLPSKLFFQFLSCSVLAIILELTKSIAQARHYVEKPESYISDIINGGIYLFDKSIFDEIRTAMDDKMKKNA